MQLKLLSGYPDLIGRRQAFVGYGAGPALYNPTTGDVLTQTGYEKYYDYVFNTPPDPTNTWYAKAIPSAVGTRATWTLRWYAVSNNTEATAINLSAISLQVAGFMGEY